MTRLDRFLQRWRISKVRRHIAPGDRVLDIGCGDSALHRLVPCIREYVGVDPAVCDQSRDPSFRLIRGAFPDAAPARGEFDAVVMLASLEHVPEDSLPRLAGKVNELLRMHGKLLITVPHPRVDGILAILSLLRAIDSDDMKAHEHHAFDADLAAKHFLACGFRLVRRERFQLGLNNCFVLEKVLSSDPI